MELYLIRHGDMAGDPHQHYVPPVAECLSELGCRQAAAATTDPRQAAPVASEASKRRGPLRDPWALPTRFAREAGTGRASGQPRRGRLSPNRFTEPVAVSSTASAGFPTWPCGLPVQPSDAASTYSRSVLRASSNLGDRSRSDKTPADPIAAKSGMFFLLRAPPRIEGTGRATNSVAAGSLRLTAAAATVCPRMATGRPVR